MNSKIRLITLAMVMTAVVAVVGSVLAPSNIDPTHKFSWSENTGWWNWREANGGAEGVLVGDEFLTGYVWGENMGWIDVGAGDGPYANTTGLDFGVNVLGGGDLDGYAWSENRGWINFGWAASTANPERARFDSSANRFRGYAWAENDGWINLDDTTHYVAKEAPSLLPLELPTDPTHQVLKNRYLSIDPQTNPTADTVLKVEVAQMRRCQNAPTRGCMTDSDCDTVCDDVAGAPPYHTLKCPPADCSTTVPPSTCIASGPCVDLAPTFNPPLTWIVQQPIQDPTGGCKSPGCPPYPPGQDNCCEDDDWMAYLGATVPPLTGGYTSWADVWMDLPAGVLHITDCGIVPATTYAVYACDSDNLDQCSDPLMIGTQRFPVNDRPIAFHLY
ncbi:MAG: hypothetical protein ACYTFA_18045, partial [Planctomycetota bacterium]